MKRKFRNLKFPLLLATILGLVIGLLFLGVLIPIDYNYSNPDSTMYPDTYGNPNYPPFMGREYTEGETWVYLGFLIAIMAIIIIFAAIQFIRKHKSSLHLQKTNLKSKKNKQEKSIKK